MNQYVLPSPALTVEGGNQSPESDPQLFINDTTFWQGVPTFFTCPSPHSPFDYHSDDFAFTSPTSPNENTFKTAESTKSSRPRKRAQTEELLLKRRAQNRASQRAYRERRDQHVRELETQLEEMAKRNEELTREHEALRCAHEKLKAEQEYANHEHAEGVSQMLSSEDRSGLIVKVVVCKRCFGDSAPAKCEVGIWDA